MKIAPGQVHYAGFRVEEVTRDGSIMKTKAINICAQNPALLEYTLCGNSIYDMKVDELAAIAGDKVTCKKCLRGIEFIYEIYTKGGKVK